ncbi:DUF6716 putative glycosyltransferase [Cyanobium sp. NIES-981]|uniref:DUF6716 putative glycosyltransferase n=1 Tax=Cyanobium sp. NIES-981 TaxID=1851505 RepID=UPI0007DD91B2|nr:DUF6716 putative glycosyltransferase [Cyanobium sp. NIES-981]SBO44575.1 conserved protein of unknown function [Cyanobium sp. NIES-981]
MSSVLLIADSDSQLLYCEALARDHAACGIRLTINLIPREGTPEAVKQRMHRLGTVQERSMGVLLQDADLGRYSGIGVFLTGSKIAAFRSAYIRSRQQHPDRDALLFCGFNGVVLERFEEAVTWRLGYDLICLNGPRDQVRFERMVGPTPYHGQATVITGLRRSLVTAPPAPSSRLRQLVFAEQVAMPARLEERERLVALLVGLARRFPDWRIVMKPRVARHEATFHDIGEHISDTLARVTPAFPPNLVLSYSPLPQLLRESRLFATLSSTAFFDALDHGCTPLLVGDFGLRSDLGTHFFGGSDLMVRLEDVQDLDALVDRQGNPDWLRWVGYDPSFSPASLFSAIQARAVGACAAPDPREPALGLQQRGYVVNSADLSSNQLRLNAEEAIATKDYLEAARLLEMAALQRPDHGNIQRRLAAVRARNRLWRRILLLVTPRFSL